MKIIFGASNGGENYLKVSKLLEIDFFLDNDKNKHEKVFFGYEIKSPDVLKDLELKNLRVIVASEHYQDIKEQLLNYGLVENIHFWDGLKEIGHASLKNTPEQNIKLEMQKRALNCTVNFVLENMSNVPSFESSTALLDYSLDQCEIEGLVLEFGVYRGTSVNFISNKVNKIYGFDSFEGLPADWREGYPKSTFALAALPIVNENVELVVGWFDESLPPFLENYQEICSFIHIDCDLYSSTKTIFNLLADRIQKGTVIVFDEFFNYPGWEKGEFKAFFEFLDKSNLQFEYIGYNHFHEQVAVKII